MTGIVLQARLGSQRLPRKTLLPLGDSTLVGQAMRRLALVPADARILATDEASAPELGPEAAREGFELLVGSAEDVLARYCDAIRRYRLDLVVRATGDNPLVSHELVLELLARKRERSSDYAGFLNMPLGMGVELVEASALLRAEAEALERPEREHVCPYLYGHPELFSIDRPDAPAAYLFPEGRVTVDTPSDYLAMQGMYEALYRGAPIPSLEVVRWLREKAERDRGKARAAAADGIA